MSVAFHRKVVVRVGLRCWEPSSPPASPAAYCRVRIRRSGRFGSLGQIIGTTLVSLQVSGKSSSQRSLEVKDFRNLTPIEDVLHHSNLLHTSLAGDAIVIPNLVDTHNLA